MIPKGPCASRREYPGCRSGWISRPTRLGLLDQVRDRGAGLKRSGRGRLGRSTVSTGSLTLLFELIALLGQTSWIGGRNRSGSKSTLVNVAKAALNREHSWCPGPTTPTLRPATATGRNRYDGNKPYPHPHVICVAYKKIIDPALGVTLMGM